MQRSLLPVTVALAVLATLASDAAAPVTDPLRRSAVVQAVEKAGPAVVNIGTERIIVVRRDPFWELFGDVVPESPGGTRQLKKTSLGSGVIIDPAGYIVTNEHVVRRASGIYVTLADSDTPIKAQLIASHPEHDIAVIKIDHDAPLPYAEFADSDDLLIGETAIAIGNPFGLENSVTTGVVSAARRSITARGQVIFEDFIQTDAAINFGNSGGALVDIHGRLIGINTAMRYGAENIGFAIPVNKVKQSLEMLLDPRQLKQLWVGVVLENDDKNLCRVAAVDEGSPADQAGVKQGDVIEAIDGRPIHGAYDYDLTMLKRSVGDRVVFTADRGGTRREFTLTLVAAPKPSGEKLALELFGMTVRDFTEQDAEALGLALAGGVLITDIDPEGPAARKRFQKGDVIVRVGRYSVPGVEQLGMLLEHVESGNEALFWVVRDDYLIGNYITAK